MQRDHPTLCAGFDSSLRSVVNPEAYAPVSPSACSWCSGVKVLDEVFVTGKVKRVSVLSVQNNLDKECKKRHNRLRCREKDIY